MPHTGGGTARIPGRSSASHVLLRFRGRSDEVETHSSCFNEEPPDAEPGFCCHGNKLGDGDQPDDRQILEIACVLLEFHADSLPSGRIKAADLSFEMSVAVRRLRYRTWLRGLAKQGLFLSCPESHNVRWRFIVRSRRTVLIALFGVPAGLVSMSAQTARNVINLAAHGR